MGCLCQVNAGCFVGTPRKAIVTLQQSISIGKTIPSAFIQGVSEQYVDFSLALCPTWLIYEPN